MKRINLLLLFVAVLATAGAQTLNYTNGSENKKIKLPQVSNMHIVGQQDGLLLGVTDKYTTFLKNHIKKEIMVVALDENMNIVRSIELPETKDSYTQTATYFEGKVYLLTSRKEKTSTYYERTVVDATTMQKVGETTTIYTYTSERKDQSFQWIEQSPNGTLSGLIHITTSRKSDKFEAVQILLDEEMNIEWQRDYAIYSLSNMLVTDDGEIITIGYSGGKTGSVYISVLNEANAFDFEEPTNLKIKDVRLAGYKDGKILGVGFGINASKDDAVQYFGIAADIKSQRVNIGYQTLTDQECNILANIDLSKKSRGVYTDILFLKHCQPTEYGAVATIQTRMIVETCNQNGGCSIKSYSYGTLIFGIDNDGNVAWHHGIRKSMKQNGYPTLLTDAVCVEGSDVYLLQSESPKWAPVYNVEKKAKTQKMNSGTKVLGVYHIDANGSIIKEVEKMNKAVVLNDNTKKVGNSHIGFLYSTSGISMIKMKF